MNALQMKILTILDAQPAPIETGAIVASIDGHNARLGRVRVPFDNESFAFSMAQLELDAFISWSGNPRRWAITDKGARLMLERARMLGEING